MVFNASLGSLLLIVLGILKFLFGLTNPDLVESAISGELPFFTVWVC
jgi:hypothetical protein